MLTERVDGVWNRIIVAGVSPFHFLVSHMVEGLIIVTFQFIQTAIYVFLVFSSEMSFGSNFLLLSTLLMIEIAGVCFGLFLSAAVTKLAVSYSLVFSFTFSVVFVSGELRKCL